MKVFWSWQFDTPGRTGRHFIREALAFAIEELKVEAEVEEPDRNDPRAALHLDHDRQGVPGSPDLARIIFDKISQAAVFVADVTPVGIVNGRDDLAKKKLINANVAIELGYSLGTIGDGALLMVLNEHYGNRDDLPFDLRAKGGPLLFRLAPEANKDEVAAASRKLVPQLKQAISLCLDKKVEGTRKTTPFPEATEKGVPGRFRERGGPLGVRWDSHPFGTESETPIFLAEGPSMWLRLMPSSATGKTIPSHELRDKALSGSFDLKPISDQANIFALRAVDGFGIYSSYLPETSATTSMAFAFETGEVWSIDTDQLRYGETIPFVEPIFVRRMQDYARFLTSLDLEPPYRWKCGMTGVRGYRLQVPVQSGYTRYGPGPLCLSETIKAEGMFDGVGAAQSALYPFFKEVFDRCGVPRPDHLPR